MNKALNKEDVCKGLFTVDCEYCSKTFAIEDAYCVCGFSKGEIQLNIELFLERVYSLASDDFLAMDLIFYVYYHLYDKFDVMNDVLSKIDTSKLNDVLLIGFMTHTFKYINKVPNHVIFCDKAAVRMKEMGHDDDLIHKLVDRYRKTGNYWERMEAYGAPIWLSGPK